MPLLMALALAAQAVPGPDGPHRASLRETLQGQKPGARPGADGPGAEPAALAPASAPARRLSPQERAEMREQLRRPARLNGAPEHGAPAPRP